MLNRVVRVRERDLKFIYRAWDLESQGNEGKKPLPPLLRRKRQKKCQESWG